MLIGSEDDAPDLIDMERDYRLAVKMGRQEVETPSEARKRKWSGGTSDDEKDEDYCDEDAFIDKWWELGEAGNQRAEGITLALPSSLSLFDRKRVGWVGLGQQEIELRRGRINDILTDLRLLLGEKMMRFRNLRQNRSQKDQRKAFSGLQTLQRRILLTQQQYRRQVCALKRLGDKTNWLDIRKEDLVVGEANKEQDRTGQASQHLAWFWRYGEDISKEMGKQPNMEPLVYRVNYLQAQAGWQRWNEELTILKKESKWRLAWFQHQRSIWESRGNKVMDGSGMRVYALQMAYRWLRFEQRSEKKLREGGLLG
ncbi:hypothetical protein VKT23_017074 [Stygiomarasmius scandens]|uniref:Uncharacterized protein n=1 Tax=Marasmiellus scandens TaxID=2682957 RepID=A0ABR1IXA9_9AGAR